MTWRKLSQLCGDSDTQRVNTVGGLELAMDLCGQRKAGKRQGDLEEPGMLPSSEELAVGMGGDLPSHTARSRIGC